jgi:hypothetical protein
MAEFIIAIDHITYYVVQAEDEVTAIDLVLEGEGKRFPPRRAMPTLARMSAATRDHTRDPQGQTVRGLRRCGWRHHRCLSTQTLMMSTHE